MSVDVGGSVEKGMEDTEREVETGSDGGAGVEVPITESRSEMLARQQKELKELQNREIGLKKAAARGSKAEQKAKKKLAEEEIAKLDSKMRARHVKELASLGVPVDIKDANIVEGLVKAIAGVTTTGASQSVKPSKGQKWRDRRAQQAAEREQRIQEEQNNVVSERAVEDEELRRKLVPLGFSLKEIKPDGHCLYRAVEDQLALSSDSTPHSYQELRSIAADHMRAHPDEFIPFIGAETSDTELPGQTLQSKFETYCQEVESTPAWGGQLELGALSHALKRHIVVYSANLPDVEMGKEYADKSTAEDGVLRIPSIRLSYHRHAFGLGEHYNSVVPLEASLVEPST